VVDNNDIVFNILKGIGYPTFFQYPDNFAVFPCISYWDSNHSSDGYLDGKSTEDIVESTIDVWEKADPTTGELIKIHAIMDSLMRGARFLRTNPIHSVYEPTTHIYHYTGKYKKIYEEVD
jgi:hypothetical protein